jgi:hypothetical protein
LVETRGGAGAVHLPPVPVVPAPRSDDARLVSRLRALGYIEG